MRTITLTIATLFNLLSASFGAGQLLGIPTVPFTSSNGSYDLSSVKNILVDAAYASAVDNTKDTLIPPTLSDFAAVFAEDLNLTVTTGDMRNISSDCIVLTIDSSNGTYLDAAGNPSSEGYTLTVSSTGIIVKGASPLGVFWGTRTILQQAALNGGSLSVGTGVDTPGWGDRGMMLDAGRHFYPKEFITEMCSYMSFFKQNVFHLHLSDNLYNNENYTREQSLDLYARFRLWSDSDSVAGLNKYPNESYTRADFNQIQSTCAKRGVTIIPEIEAPGHALVIVQWKPEIGYGTDLSLLNITHPETIPTMETIWSEFLPWFHTKIVSVGADEYTGPASDYNTFVNDMASFIGTKFNKSIRIWGTFPPDSSYSNNIFHNVSVQHWEYFEDNPYYDYILNNYSVMNSNDDFYIVNKWAPAGGYLNTINLTKTFVGNPVGQTYWRPYIFDQSNATNNPPESNPLVLGAIAPMWNDYGANASVYLEAYYAWREGIPALADKQWGGNLSTSDFSGVFEKLHGSIPAQNLDRPVAGADPSSDVIFNYTFSPTADGGSKFGDLSPNGFDVEVDCLSDDVVGINSACGLTTPFSSKGRNYTLTLAALTIASVEDATNTTLVTGSDSVLMLTPNITFFSGGNFFRLNSTVPLNKTVDLSIIARGNKTYASVGSAPEEEFLAIMGINGLYHHWAEIAFEAPIQRVGGGWTGTLRGLSLTS